MASAKTATLTFRIEPELKEAVRLASVNEHRSIANMIAVMIRDYFERVGLKFRHQRRSRPRSSAGPRINCRKATGGKATEQP